VAVTIKDIAQSVGVPHPTVCCALRGDPPVVSDTAARSLKASRSHAMVNRISDPFYGEVPDGIQDILPAADYSSFLSSTNHNLDRRKAILQSMTERRINRLIMCSMFVTLQYRAGRSMFVGLH
jgi:DNA-binding LacI/PurR family transcriptional regulator